MTTIHDLLQEMQSFVPVPEELLEKAKNSTVNELTYEFDELLSDWQSGRYDEDPEMVIQNIEYLLEKYA